MTKPIEFKAGTLTAMSAFLREIDNVRLADALQVMLGGMGEFFAGEPTIIDVSRVKNFPDRADWSGLLSLLRRYGLQPVALRGAPDHLLDSARKAGLAVLVEDHGKLSEARDAAPAQPEPALAQPEPALARPEPALARPEPAAAAEASAAQTAQPASLSQAMVVDRTIRSGQQIYAKGCDLVVLGSVSHGAEVIADGSIHCYGSLRGRALAGAAGNKAAQIYSTNFGPELIAVAGIYRTFEKGIPENIAGKAAQALLRSNGDEQSLILQPLQLD